jgi:rare lipoprotein A (peptidoglycan hydrolase)
MAERTSEVSRPRTAEVSGPVEAPLNTEASAFARNGATPERSSPIELAATQEQLPRVAVDTANGATITREHTVAKNEKLWTIARDQLKETGQTVTNNMVHRYVNQIMDANRTEHPEIAANPGKIKPGQKVLLPEFKSDYQPSRPAGMPEGGEQPQERSRKPKGAVEPQRAVEPGASDQRAGEGQPIRASWYGPGFHGRRTASGERYDQDGLTAAHKTLPLGSRIEVTNPNNGRSLTLRVNDRGPFIPGRDLDLSRGAARFLGTIDEGVASLRMRVKERPHRV